MKIIKLLILAAVVGGVIWLIPKIGSIVSSDSGKPWDVVLEQNDVLKQFDSEYTKDWKDRKEWDRTLYNAHYERAAQIKTGGEIDSPTYDKLMININNTVLEKLVSLLEADYKKETIPEQKVENNLLGIDELAPKMPDDKKIAKMKGAWSAYRSIKQFANKAYSSDSFQLGMTGDGSSWTSFDTHKSSVLSARDRYRQNAYYKEYFSDNKMLKSGLASVESKVESCRQGYNRRILNAIRQKYGNVPSFNPSQYFSAMRSAANESEWNEAKRGFENAWNSYESDVLARKQRLGRISTTFKSQVGDASLKMEMSAIAGNFSVPRKPSAPSKPNF